MNIKVVLNKVDMVSTAVFKNISLICMVVLFLLLAGNVLVRFIPLVSMGWFDEIIEMSFVWMVFSGAAVLWRDSQHFQIDFLLKKVQGRFRGVLLVFIDIVSLTFFSILLYNGTKLTILARALTPIIKMPKRVLYSCIPLAAIYLVIYTIRNLYIHTIQLIYDQKTLYEEEIINEVRS